MNKGQPASDLPVIFRSFHVIMHEVVILNDISLTIASGPPTVLIGPNGAGKTTLLCAAMGLIPATNGIITWGGLERTRPLHRAILFQHSVMLRRSAGNNLRYALAISGTPYRQRRNRVAELLSLVGLSDLERRPARRLSGGEQRRLALARTLARDPDLLFLDEPTASLDPAASRAIENIILDIARRGVKVVISTHDLGQARRLAGEIILLHRGRLIEQSSAADFFAVPRTAEAAKFIAGELLV